MQDIIKIENRIIGEDFIKAVDARELYEYLESRQEFSNWIKRRIEQYGFIENLDYISFDKKVGREIGGSIRTEYYISLDMAKELSMVEKNDKGRLARKYFIECEKRLDALKENNYPNYLRMLADEMEAKQNALLEIERLKPFEEIVDNAKAIFPNKDYSEGEKAYKKDIKLMYPFLGDGKINNILEFYTTKKYKDSVYYIKDEIEECMKKFFRDCKYRISDSRISVIATHECLLNSKCVISKEYAIEYLGFLEEEFDL